MKKKPITLFLVIITFSVYFVFWAFYDMERLPKGELLLQVHSPSETYSIKAYRTNGGATTAYAIRGELNFNNSRKKPKNIYWNYREDQAVIEWVDEDTVIINGIELDVPNEKFDFRRN